MTNSMEAPQKLKIEMSHDSTLPGIYLKECKSRYNKSKQCYEKQIMLREGHIREREGKRRKLRR
jgi:hypothetical protein